MAAGPCGALRGRRGAAAGPRGGGERSEIGARMGAISVAAVVPTEAKGKDEGMGDVEQQASEESRLSDDEGQDGKEDKAEKEKRTKAKTKKKKHKKRPGHAKPKEDEEETEAEQCEGSEETEEKEVAAKEGGRDGGGREGGTRGSEMRTEEVAKEAAAKDEVPAKDGAVQQAWGQGAGLEAGGADAECAATKGGLKETKTSPRCRWLCIGAGVCCCCCTVIVVAMFAAMMVMGGAGDEGDDAVIGGVAENSTTVRVVTRKVVYYSGGCGNATAAGSDNCTNGSNASNASGGAAVVIEEVVEEVSCPYLLASAAADDGCPRGTLKVEVAGIEAGDGGTLRVVVYASGDAWGSDSRYRGGRAAAVRGLPADAGAAATVEIGGLLHGEYGVVAHHDEDDNGKLNTFFGFPREGAGASRGARGGPGGGPKWRDAKFGHEGALTVQPIELWYA